MNKIKIAIVEDQRLFRDGMLALLREQDDFQIVTNADNGKTFLAQLSDPASVPDVALVDLNMPEINGPELTAILQQRYPSIKIIILTVYNQERFISNMIEAGVSGYLVKNCDIEEVTLAIRTAHNKGFYLNDSTLKAMRNGYKQKSKQLRSFSNIPIELTAREIEILKLICAELTNAEIASHLHISARTVDGHRNNLLAKTGCKNTAGLVLFAVSQHIIETSLFDK